MADIRNSIVGRLSELEDERQRLTLALESLGESVTVDGDKPVKVKATKNGKRKRNGNRQAEIVTMLAAGDKPTAIAKALGVSPSYVYTTRTRMAQQQ